ncbi:MAG TPA: 6-bladed beta-propeller, partial [Thermoanaerobaculia bacterium]|nr:6-bladed beta-propeller [Thermoanaerobaculia bacterium]
MTERSAFRLFGPLLLLGAAAGCASAWKLRTAEAPFPLQWPFAPSPARVTYLRALTGVSSSATVGSALAAVAYGSERAEANAFVLPVAVATWRDGRMAVADMGRGAVHLVFPRTSRYLRLTGPKTAPMRTPVALAFDDDGRLFVSDSSSGLYVFGPDGAFLSTIRSVGGTPLGRPTGVAWSPTRRLLYVVDTLAHAIYALDAQGRLVRTIGGRGDGPGQFNFPTHVALTPAGELVVADSLNFRIQMFDPEGTLVGMFGAAGANVGGFNKIKGLAFDSA